MKFPRPPNRSPSQILVISDQSLARANMRRTLEYYGYAVLEAPNARDGLQQFHRERSRISLVVIDLSPNDVPEVKLLAGLRTIERDVKVAVCTDQPTTELKKQTPYQGVTGILRKPVSTDRLLALVRKSLEA